MTQAVVTDHSHCWLQVCPFLSQARLGRSDRNGSGVKFFQRGFQGAMRHGRDLEFVKNM